MINRINGRTMCAACAFMVVTAHGLHYATYPYRYQPNADTHAVAIIRTGVLDLGAPQAADMPREFDSEGPGLQVERLTGSNATPAPTGDVRAQSGVATLGLTAYSRSR